MKHIVGFSGGIDSQACARWVLNRFPKEDVILLNSDVGGHEHPITTEFIAWYSANVHPVQIVTPLVKDLWATEGYAEKNVRAVAAGLTGEDALTFGRLLQIKGRPPSRSRQFCTTFLKLVPAKRWITENVTDEFRRYSGVRRSESASRRNTPPEEWDNVFDCDVWHPICDWSKSMCFDYVKGHGEQVNPLYSMGFDRVGCAPCINSGKEDILNWSLRFPAMIDKVREWERSSGITFFMPMVPGLATNTIDQVVEWSKTTHGGRQVGLHVLHQPLTCQSAFGLCE